jgi:hypothetical protein
MWHAMDQQVRAHSDTAQGNPAFNQVSIPTPRFCSALFFSCRSTLLL